MRLSRLAVLHSRHSFARYVSHTALLILACAVPAFAQVGGIDPDPGDPGTGGKNTIQGRIFLPSGQRLDRRVKVKLVSLASVEQFQLSDDSGAFTFRRLQGGKYTVVIDAGNEFEISSESVDIVEPPRRRGDPGITVPVYITLQLRRTGAATAPGTVSATAATIPEPARELYKLALDSANSGDRKKAIEQLDKALEIYPTFLAALNQLGVQYMELKQWEKATVPLRKALDISPGAFQPRLNHGIVMVQMKKYNEAVADLKIAVQRDGSSGTAHFYLGRAMVNVGDYDAAETALRQSISLAGDEAVEAHRYLGAVYIEKRNSVQAAAELETYLKLAPNAKDADRIRAIIKDLRSQAPSKRS